MKKKTGMKRMTALLIAMAMALSLLSAGVWADELDSSDVSGPDCSAQAEPEAAAQEAAEEAEPETAETGDADADDATLSMQDDDEDDDDERSLDEVPATPMPDFSANGDWRLPADASEVYLKCAQAVIDGKETPDFDVHFECDGVTVDYIYNGDGTYTLSTAGDMGDSKSMKKMKKDFAKKYKNNVGNSSYDSFCYGTRAEYNWLSIPANRSTSELQARYEEMVAFYNAVKEFEETKFRVTKVYCDSTYTVTKKYSPNLTYKKKCEITYYGVGAVFAPLNETPDVCSPWYDENNRVWDWRNSVVEFTFGPHVQTASGVWGCPNLTKLNWGESKVTNILDDMFDYCPSLKEIRIPATVKLIGNYVFESRYHSGYDGPTGNIGGAYAPQDKTLVFEGDITIGTYWANSNLFSDGITKVIAMKNLTLRAESALRARKIEVRGDLHTDDLNPAMDSKWHKKHPGYLGSALYADSVTVYGNAYMGWGGFKPFLEWLDSDSEEDPGPISKIDVRGDLVFDGSKCPNKFKNVSVGPGGTGNMVKNIKVGGNLFLYMRSDLPTFGKDCLESITVKGTVHVAKPEVTDFEASEYYPIKSHGTTTAKEALKHKLYDPAIVSAKSNAKGKIIIKWRMKDPNSIGRGYEIQYRVVSNREWSKKNSKSIRIKNVKKKSITISKLKSGKTYEIRIRSLGKGGKVSQWKYVDDCPDIGTIKVK